jgi:hypothetical protein
LREDVDELRRELVQVGLHRPELVSAPEEEGEVEASGVRRFQLLENGADVVAVHANRDLAVTDLAERAGVLALHPRRVFAILDDPRVVDDPGDDADLRRHPLGAGADQKPRIPGRVGQKLLHRLVAGRRLLQPKQRRLQALAAALLDQPAHVHKRVLALPPKRQPRRHPLNKAEQPVTNLDRRHLNCNRRLHQLLLER